MADEGWVGGAWAHEGGAAADAEQIDSVALWLLRLGIDSRGQLVLNRLWDVAVRAAVLVDLRVSGRIVDSDTMTYIDEPTSDGEYEDTACRQLLAGRVDSEEQWVERGGLRARDVAARLISSGEWKSRPAPLTPGGRTYRAAREQYPALREHLLTVAREATPARSPHEFATLVLADSLHALSKEEHDQLVLRLDECGPYRSLVSHARIAIRTREALMRVASAGGG